ncbi:Uncharacterised protein [Staphylococcus aureus]|nr:Uncharacterised protein [Staphylococcus aureus]
MHVYQLLSLHIQQTADLILPTLLSPFFGLIVTALSNYSFALKYVGIELNHLSKQQKFGPTPYL